MDKDKEKKTCSCGCGGNGKKTPCVSTVIIVLCAIWIIGRLIYFYCGDGCGQKCKAVENATSSADTKASAAEAVINGILASDLEVLRAKAVSDPAFANAFKRLSNRRRELAAQQTAVEFDYKNWLNSWAATNKNAKAKIEQFRSLAKKDQSDPNVAAEMAKVSDGLRKFVGEDPVGAALLVRCEALLPETEAVERLYAGCVKAMAAADKGTAEASENAGGGAENAPGKPVDLSNLRAGPASEPVALAVTAAVSTNSSSEVKASERVSAETKELKE